MEYGEQLTRMWKIHCLQNVSVLPALQRSSFQFLNKLKSYFKIELDFPKPEEISDVNSNPKLLYLSIHKIT